MVDELQAAMQNDASESTHPMINPVSTPAQISKIFDSITYGKCKYLRASTFFDPMIIHARNCIIIIILELLFPV